MSYFLSVQHDITNRRRLGKLREQLVYYGIEFIRQDRVYDIFNPMEKVEKQLSGISEQLDKLARLQESSDDINCRRYRKPQIHH